MLDHPKLSPESRKALASLRLEGIYPSEEALADMVLFDTGIISMQEFRQRSLKRATSTDIIEPCN